MKNTEQEISKPDESWKNGFTELGKDVMVRDEFGRIGLGSHEELEMPSYSPTPFEKYKCWCVTNIKGRKPLKGQVIRMERNLN